MQTFPKLFTMFASGTNGEVLVSAPANNRIRLHRVEISIANSATSTVAGANLVGISYKLKDGSPNDVYSSIYLPIVAITNIPGDIKIVKDFGPLGVLCYELGGISSVYAFFGNNLPLLQYFFLHYNFEQKDS